MEVQKKSFSASLGSPDVGAAASFSSRNCCNPGVYGSPACDAGRLSSIGSLDGGRSVKNHVFKRLHRPKRRCGGPMGVENLTFRGRDSCTLKLKFHGLSIAEGLRSETQTKDNHRVENSNLIFSYLFFDDWSPRISPKNFPIRMRV